MELASGLAVVLLLALCCWTFLLLIDNGDDDSGAGSEACSEAEAEADNDVGACGAPSDEGRLDGDAELMRFLS